MTDLPADFGGTEVTDLKDDGGSSTVHGNGNGNFSANNDAEVEAYHTEAVEAYRNRVLSGGAVRADSLPSESKRRQARGKSNARLNPCLCRGCARPRFSESKMDFKVPYVLSTATGKLEVFRRSTQKPIVLTNDAPGGDGETLWEFVDVEMLAVLPAELTDPLLSLEESMKALREMLGATPLNVALSVLTLTAYGNIRNFLAVPEFVKWVETGCSDELASTPGFETPIDWPEGWIVKLRADDGYSMGNLACPRFTLSLINGRCSPAKEREPLSPVREAVE